MAQIPKTQYQVTVEPISTKPETTTVDRWWQPLSNPVWTKPGLLPGSQQAHTEPLSQRVWYVDGALLTGAQTGTSWANAWQSLGGINWASIGPGDTIYISGGSTSLSYTGSGSTTLLAIGASGTVGRSILITRGLEAGHNGTVILDGQSGGRNCIDIISGFSYVTVQRLTAQNPGPGFDCIKVDGNSGAQNGVVVQDCILHVGGTNNNLHSIGIECKNITSGSGNIFQRNFIDTADSGGDNSSNFTDQTDCIYLQNNTADNCILIQGNTCIQQNSSSNGHNDCIQFVSGGATTIRNNYCEQKYDGGNTHCLILSDPADGKVLLVYDNVLRSHGTGPVGVIAQNTVNTTTTTNGIFHLYNNTIDTQNWGISISTANVASEFKNNIIHADGASGIAFVTASWTPTATSQIDFDDVYLTNSAVYSSGTTTGWDAHKQTGNPNFINAVNYPNANYQIGAGSAAINNGTTIAAVPLDFSGLTRPQGTSYCIGAYEFIPGSFPSMGWFGPLASPTFLRTAPANQQAHAEPVSLAKETTTVDRWFQPLSTPVFSRSLPVACAMPALAWSTFTPAVVSTVTVSSWLTPFSTPVLAPSRAALMPPATGPPFFVQAPGGWLEPISLPIFSQQFQYQSYANPPPQISAPAVGDVRWYQPLATPTPAKTGLLPAQQQAHTEPVSTSPETTTVDRWFAPFSVPVLRTPSVANQPTHTEPVSESRETTTLDRWFQPLSTPLYAKASILAGQQQFLAEPLSESPETTSLDRWYQPLSLPPSPRQPPYAAAQQPFLFEPVSESPETTSLDRWFAPLSAPITPRQWPMLAAEQQTLAEPLSESPETTTVDRWWQPLSLPTPPKAGLAPAQQQAHTEPLSEAPETTSVDRWFAPLSTPSPPRAALAAAQQQAFWWSGFTPSSVVVLSFGWFTPLATPTPAKSGLLPAQQQAHTEPLSEQPETTTVDRWYPPLSVPSVLARAGLAAASQQTLAEPLSEAPETTSLDRWFAPLSQPVLQPQALKAGLQQAHTEPVSESPETTTVDKWFSPLSTLVLRYIPAADLSLQGWWLPFTPPSVAVPSYGYFSPFSQPIYPPRLNFDVNITEPISEAPGPPPPPPTPTGGRDDSGSDCDRPWWDTTGREELRKRLLKKMREEIGLIKKADPKAEKSVEVIAHDVEREAIEEASCAIGLSDRFDIDYYVARYVKLFLERISSIVTFERRRDVIFDAEKSKDAEEQARVERLNRIKRDDDDIIALLGSIL